MRRLPYGNSYLKILFICSLLVLLGSGCTTVQLSEIEPTRHIEPELLNFPINTCP
jgi:hypothetical protein